MRLLPDQRQVVLLFNDISTLMGHLVSSPRERENRDRRDSGEMKDTDREDYSFARN